MNSLDKKTASPGDSTSLIPQDVYNLILRNVPIACVDVAIVASGGVLLVRRNNRPALGQWWVPGGRVLKGERMKDAAKRKGEEEVGIECHVGPIIHTAETIFPDGPHGIPIHSINSCFLLYPISRAAQIDVRLDEHHAAYRWVTAIPPTLHEYVVYCLRGAGLDETSDRDSDLAQTAAPV